VIKVQPARSRIVKTETPDRLVLTSPPGGRLGGIMSLIGSSWIILMIVLSFQPFVRSLGLGSIVLLVIELPGVVLLLSGLHLWRKSWTLERSGSGVTYRRKRTKGEEVRSWPAADVTSFWVEEAKAPQEAVRYILMIGFRNGRSEEVLRDTFGEEVHWIAAMMKDPRGPRPTTTPPTARAVAEPVVRRVDPSAVPITLVTRKFPTGGVELTFLPMIGFKRRWWKLLAVAVGGLVAIVGFGMVIGDRNAGWISRIAVGVLLFWTLVRYLTLSRSAVVFIDSGLVTIAQNQNRGNHQLPAPEIEFVQTFRNGGESELQFLIRGKPKIRLFHGRPGEELEWAARFLRVALKHRPEEESAPMKVDATAGECQVCSETMDSRVVYCGKCRTPHHEECWSYVGQCSTYGCREIRFTRV
jgi:hypothetical protein